MDIVEKLRGAHWADASERLRLVNLAADEIERLRQLVSEMGSVAYVIDGHGIAHHNFTIVYRELE